MGRDCKYCGAYISDAYDVCPACGKRVKPDRTEKAEPYVSGGAGRAQSKTKETDGRTSYRAGPSQAADYTDYRGQSAGAQRAYTYKDEYERRYGRGEGGSEPDRRKNAVDVDTDSDAESNKLFGCLSYFGPLFIVSYLLRRDSDFVKFHCNQGLVLLAVNLLTGAASLVPVVGWMIRVIARIYVIIGFISGVLNALGGKKKPLPGLSDIEILK